MKFKHKPEDFRVRELLDESYFKPHGRFRVYRVIKKKRTSLEAAAVLADLAGVGAADVGLAGLKDRQGITTQYMSVPKGRVVSLHTPELRIEAAGFAAQALASEFSSGNEFELVVRGLSRAALDKLAIAAEEVRASGVPNYFGEQRFGNLRYNQGWIARDLLLGKHERALKSLLASPSENDDPHNGKFKSALAKSWGDWRGCRAIAGKFGAHHSVFEHLARHDGDFAGAFQFVSSRLRLIHLYAWQSHLWNRAVARYVEELTLPKDRITLSTPEGRLFFSRTPLAIDPSMNNGFRLPGPRLEDVTHARQHELLAQALRREGIEPAQFHIDGVPGFQLKGEERALVLHPQELRIAPVESERAPQAEARAQLKFVLTRGAYATLILERLFADQTLERSARKRDDRAPRADARGARVDTRKPRADARTSGQDERKRGPDTRTSNGLRAKPAARRPADKAKNWNPTRTDAPDSARGPTRGRKPKR